MPIASSGGAGQFQSSLRLQGMTMSLRSRTDQPIQGSSVGGPRGRAADQLTRQCPELGNGSGPAERATPPQSAAQADGYVRSARGHRPPGPPTRRSRPCAESGSSRRTPSRRSPAERRLERLAIAGRVSSPHVSSSPCAGGSRSAPSPARLAGFPGGMTWRRRRGRCEPGSSSGPTRASCAVGDGRP
jgi:hypothetical protein